MTEFLYQVLLKLHPPAFRERFAAEMTLNFEEAGPAERSSRLLLDGFVSVLRQRFLRSGTWKLVVAAAIASLQLVAISPFWHLHRRIAPLARAPVSSVNDEPMLTLIILCTTGFFVVLAAMVALWVRSLVSRRLKATVTRRHVVI